MNEIAAKNSLRALFAIEDELRAAPVLTADSLEPERTAFVIVDMIRGFVHEGALASERNAEAIGPVEAFSEYCQKNFIEQVAFVDTHTQGAAEFAFFPPHCVENTAECELCSGIRQAKVIKKYAVNGFLEEEFQAWLAAHSQIDTFVVGGVCSDLCVLQFVLTLRSHFNRRNESRRIVVPIDMVQTYDLGEHEGDLMNLFALYNMKLNGIELVSGVDC
ncbi:cysteine hydrolase family protein [Feifania hominis]|uniref:Cysteine hydrolase n=1 Tax=Feifania hominis TaxID=2763660 RepID=A0A926DC87_9FIRM|nr:isochorismatase family cysteine hydrolase [Feifania hominis]MBC8535164.1 cysteine hydrolase [Feifania hominis]